MSEPERSQPEPPRADGDSGPQPRRQTVDHAKYQQSLDRVTELFTSMMSTANELSTRRCPYKNRHDQCTAEFGCRNQRKPKVEADLLDCASDDNLDYRSAWEAT